MTSIKRTQGLVLAGAVALLLGYGAPAAAQLPPGTIQPCPDGGTTISWTNNYDGGIPDSAVPFDGGGIAVPLQACATLKETNGDHSGCNVDRCPNLPLPAPSRPACDPSAGGPGCPTTPTSPPSTTTAGRPLNPKGTPPVALPAGSCSSATGWDFEDGTWQGWTPSVIAPATRSVFVGNFRPLNQPAAPVYGNNVDINRINPPGYIASGPNSAVDNVGGDYWEFSRDINYDGDYWVGSLDWRPDWTVAPGTTYEETQTGALTSPVCQLNANYLTFKIGGSSTWAERVDFEVMPNAGEDLSGTRQGLGNVEMIVMPPGPLGLSTTSDGATATTRGWTIVRSSTNNDPSENDYMGRTVVWDVSQYIGHQVRIRIVDDTRNECATADSSGGCITFKSSHLNVDSFHFATFPPATTAWLPIYDQDCGTSACGYWTQSFVGSSVRPQPVWGTTDGHAHGTANTSFGGHFIWGDISDSLSNVYNCAHPLPVIKDKQGKVIRGNEADPFGYVNRLTTCTVNFDIIAVVLAEGIAWCQVLNAVPLFGSIAAGVCDLAVTGLIELINEQVIHGFSLHGGAKMTSGQVDFDQGWFSPISGAADVIAQGHSLFGGPIAGAIPQADWDMPDGTHAASGLKKTHQMYQYQMIMRAYQGGLRLIVMDAINSRAMQLAIDGRSDFDDWQAITKHIETMKRLTAGPNDPKYLQGPLYGIAQIAYTPKQVRDIIRAGQLAIVLGTEVDELGKPRPNVPNDSMQQQVADLYAMGIRKITPVHAVNNPIGATAEFQDIYQSQAFFDNAYQPSWNESNLTLDNSPIPFTLGLVFPIPFFGMGIGTWHVGTMLTHNGLPAKCGTTSASPDCWRGNSGGWLDVETGDPYAFGTTYDWIGGYDQISFRFGFTNSAYPLYPYSSGGVWSTQTSFIHPYVMNDLSWLIGAPMFSGDSCDLTGMLLPYSDKIAELDSDFRTANSHWNPHGLNPDGSGELFLRSMMQDGMILDLDHLSQHSRLQTYTLANTFANEAHYVSGNEYIEYPTYGVHTGIRGFERDSPVPAEMTNNYGYGIENERTEAELVHDGQNGGTIGVAANGSNMIPPSSAVEFGVNNDCDFSSKTWATRYLHAMKLMSGRGLLPTTDMDGLTTPLASRYGWANPNHNACHQSWHPKNNGAPDPRQAQLDDWRRDWDDAHFAKCEFNSLGAWDPTCPSTQMVQSQLQEFSGVYYDRYDTLSPIQPAWANGQPGLLAVKARSALSVRDDQAARAPIDEWVTYSSARQRRPMKPFGGWDLNLDGLPHIGLYPDFFQDVHNVGVTNEQLGPVFNAAEDFIETWERACDIASAWRNQFGESGPACQN